MKVNLAFTLCPQPLLLFTPFAPCTAPWIAPCTDCASKGCFKHWMDFLYENVPKADKTKCCHI